MRRRRAALRGALRDKGNPVGVATWSALRRVMVRCAVCDALCDKGTPHGGCFQGRAAWRDGRRRGDARRGAAVRWRAALGDRCRRYAGRRHGDAMQARAWRCAAVGGRCRRGAGSRPGAVMQGRAWRRIVSPGATWGSLSPWAVGRAGRGGGCRAADRPSPASPRTREQIPHMRPLPPKKIFLPRRGNMSRKTGCSGTAAKTVLNCVRRQGKPPGQKNTAAPTGAESEEPP